MLSDDLRRFVDDWRLGYVATVGPDGPNVSPKGTFQTLDGTRLAFAEIRSPQTRANIGADPRVEVNMIDVFARQGARFRGTAVWHGPEAPVFRDLAPRWSALFGAALAARFRGFVVISLSDVRPLRTPAYDIGATERQLRADYLARFTAMQQEHLQ